MGRHYVGCVNIDGDYLRNGTPEDHVNESNWVNFTSGVGMVIFANNNDSNFDGRIDSLSNPITGAFEIDGALDLDDIGRLWISPLQIPPENLPSNWTARITAMTPELNERTNYGKLYWSPASDTIGGSSLNLSTAALQQFLCQNNIHREIGAEGFRYGEHFVVLYELLEGEAVIASDQVCILIAPFLAIPAISETQIVYSGISSSWPDLNVSVPAALSNICEYRSIGSMNFVQDFAEIGFSSKNVNSPQSVRCVFLGLTMNSGMESEISKDVDFLFLGGANGGNIEVLPPSVLHPWGQLVVGENLAEGQKNFLRKQAVQVNDSGDLVELDVSWLQVGHVDEILAVLPTATGYKILMSDIDSAVSILSNNDNADVSDSRLLVTRSDIVDSYSTHANAIQTISDTLATNRMIVATSLGIPEDNIIRIPVAFTPTPSSRCYLPNSINFLSVKSENGVRRILIPDPCFLPIKENIENTLLQLGYTSSEIVWINTCNAHIILGEMHCITNSRRTP